MYSIFFPVAEWTLSDVEVFERRTQTQPHDPVSVYQGSCSSKPCMIFVTDVDEWKPLFVITCSFWMSEDMGVFAEKI